ncbi:MAG: redoxin domain-containing protein, partial [Rhodospirillaceae bacterium]|nr:redoxin domain-containing protein [Rhodospirillaceae bacterium]
MQGPAHEIAVGDRAPDFVLPGPDGKFYQFYERVRGRPVLLIFYPGKKS